MTSSSDDETVAGVEVEQDTEDADWDETDDQDDEPLPPGYEGGM
jgi:hypothetical protein